MAKKNTVKKLRCAVVGVNGMGQAHINGYKSHPNAEVVAIADIDPEILKTRGDQYGIEKRYTSLTEMLKHEKLDIVSVATPNKFHAPLTIEALNAGCNVLCEKPMATTVAEAEAMLAAAKKNKRKLMIDFSYRTSSQSVALKKAVDEGVFGDFYYGRTQWLRRRGAPLGTNGWFRKLDLAGAGPLYDLGVHRLDLALWLMGYPKPVYVMGSKFHHLAEQMEAEDGHEFSVEDMAVALIRFDNGATLELEASWLGNIRENELMQTRLLGTKAGLVQHNITSGENFGGYEFDAEIFSKVAGVPYDLKLHGPVPEVHSHFYNFAESVLKNIPHDATGEQGLTVMKILEAINKSANTGKPVQIK